MSTNIDNLKRKLLIKYPTFGSVITNLEIQENRDIETALTNGKILLYNPDFLNMWNEKQQMFILAHEICHVAFEHIFRSEGKDRKIWNKATDAVINALLQKDGLEMPEITKEVNGELKKEKYGVDIPEAANYNAEEMYNKLLEEQQQNQEVSTNQGNEEQQNTQEQTKMGSGSHDLWDKAIEERKNRQQNQEVEEEKQQGQNQTESKDEREITEEKRKEEKSKFAEQGEIETFKQNKIEKRKRLQELSKELAHKSSQKAGEGIQREGRRVSDIGIAKPLIDWRKLLRQAIKYDEEWTRKNARMRNGYFRHRVEQIPIPETEILLDTSGSVSEILLKNFLRECKNIIDNSKVKVGCFNTEFHGFTELKRAEEIDNMKFPIGGGTNFNVAVQAFSRRVSNKIIFTDGEAPMPEKIVRNVIWIVFGDEKINPKGGKVINITDEQLKKLYSFMQEGKLEHINRVMY